MAGTRSFRNSLLIVLLVLSLCSSLGQRARAEGPIEVLFSTTCNNFPVELFFDIAVVDEVSDVVSIQLSFRMRGQGSETIAPLEFDPGRQAEASYRWYTERITIPPGIPIEYYWVIVDEEGHRLRTEPQTVYYDDVRFDWQVLEHNDVAVFWYGGGEELGHKLFDSAVAALQRLSATTEARLEYPIRIVIYASEEGFRSAFPYLNEWVGGRAFTDAALIVLYVESDAASLSWTLERGIPHEISHILFHQATEHPYSSPPAWLDEGLAMHNENVSHSREMTLVRQAVQRGELLSLAQISGGFPADSEAARLSYAESLSTVEFILGRYGAEAMAAFLQAFKEGKTTDEATRQAFSLSLDDFEVEWKDYLAQISPPAQPGLPSIPIRVPRNYLALLAGGLLCCGGVVALAAFGVLVLILSKRART